MAGLEGILTHDYAEDTQNYHYQDCGSHQQKNNKILLDRPAFAAMPHGFRVIFAGLVSRLNFSPFSCKRLMVRVFPVSNRKAEALQGRLRTLQCSEQDLEEAFLKGKGVLLRHRATGIRIRCCRQTSQALNRFLARRLLADELEARQQNKTRNQVKAETLREAKGKRCTPRVADQLKAFALRPSDHGAF